MSPGPAVITHAQIAEAVHQAVCTVTGSDGFRKCLAYAWPGAVVASVVTGRPHIMQAGGIEIWTGDVNDDGEAALVLDPLATGPEGDSLEFHAWFSPEPPGVVRGVPATVRRDSLIIADLSMRHFRQYIARSGVPWAREPLPAYCWATAHEISAKLRVTYYPDVQATRTVTERAGTDPEPLQDIAVLALHRLHCIDDRELRDLLHQPHPLAGEGWTTTDGIVFTR